MFPSPCTSPLTCLASSSRLYVRLLIAVIIITCSEI
ncbi:hypothetical protein MGSAQ_001283 [marine sediment metagenome]|uniref:Uncharacterized protein n=1 Tax=marine sediment metagenome TaxID=412755 RepID=A0A1B6NV75_9ZZZZ